MSAEARTNTATTMNFVVWIDDAAIESWVVERAAKVGEKHPSRVIVLDGAPEHAGDDVAPAEIDDRVNLSVGQKTAAQIGELTGQLLVPEVPTVLWWTGDRLGAETALEAMLALADAVVVDSSGTAADANAIRELTAVAASFRNVALRDLAWMRLRPWQDMVAQFFDDPHLMEEVFSIRSLTIISGSDAEALYLGGWLASRLGWNATAPDEFTDRNGHAIPFTHRREGQIRRVGCVAIETATSRYIAEVTDDLSVVALSVTGQYESPDRFAPLQAIDNISLLERAVLQPGTDELFETSLRMVATLLG